MSLTDQTLLEQLGIGDADIARRKALLGFTDEHARILRACRPHLDNRVDDLVERFYARQITVPEVALLIGDKDTLRRLHQTQRRYVLDLFSGLYGQEYVNSRLRIGMTHKRIGVDPALHLAAVHGLRSLLVEEIGGAGLDEDAEATAVAALDKLLTFDSALVFETYIRSMVAEIEAAKAQSDLHAHDLELMVRERTRELEEMARTDAVTGLRNRRDLEEFLTRALRAAERRTEPLTVIVFDIDDFKRLNDTYGHQHGDEMLRLVGDAVQEISRAEDGSFRWGGDEFCIVLPDCGAEEAGRIFVDRLRKEIRRRRPELSISVGTASCGPEEYLDAGALLKRADERMYAEKNRRRAAGHG